jgi:hypothetical protein
VLVEQSPTGFGIDYTFDATGNVEVMRVRTAVCHLYLTQPSESR